MLKYRHKQNNLRAIFSLRLCLDNNFYERVGDYSVLYSVYDTNRM